VLEKNNFFQKSENGANITVQSNVCQLFKCYQHWSFQCRSVTMLMSIHNKLASLLVTQDIFASHSSINDIRQKISYILLDVSVSCQLCKYLISKTVLEVFLVMILNLYLTSEWSQSKMRWLSLILWWLCFKKMIIILI